ncbi:hypothetical protein ACU8KH_00585 [Lachancea thermotolerans]
MIKRIGFCKISTYNLKLKDHNSAWFKEILGQLESTSTVQIREKGMQLTVVSLSKINRQGQVLAIVDVFAKN